MEPNRGETAGNNRSWKRPIALAGVSVLLLFQAWSYFRILPLILGPRVILQPWLMSKGFILYDQIADLHTPLMPLLLSIMAPLFHELFELARAALVALLTLTTLLTFVVGKRKSGWLGGLWAVWFFTMWSYTFMFMKLWHEAFLAPLFMLLFLFEGPSGTARSRRSQILLGCLGGVLFLFKQQAVVPFAVFVLWSLFTEPGLHSARALRWRKIGWIGMGAALPVLAFSAYQFLHAHTLRGFWYWTLGYHLEGAYVSQAGLRPTVEQAGLIVSAGLLVPAAALFFIEAARKKDPSWKTFGILLSMLLAGCITAYPRFNFFHLQPALPVLAVLSSLTLSHAIRRAGSARIFPTGIAMALSVFWTLCPGYGNYRPVFKPTNRRPIYEYSTVIPLVETLRPYVKSTDRLYVFPDYESNSNLYYCMRRTPPSFWIFHYPWFLSDRIRARILESLEASPPDCVVYFPDWFGTVSAAPDIDRYIKTNYRLVIRYTKWWDQDVLLLRRIQ